MSENHQTDVASCRGERNRSDHLPQKPTVHDIAGIVAEVMGRRVLDVGHLDAPGISNDVFLVVTDEGRFVVRTNAASHLANYGKEAWCLERLAASSVPVPRVVATGVAGECAYSIAPYIENSSPIDATVKRLHVWKTRGGYAARLNRLPISGFGADMVKPGEFNATWHEVVDYDLDVAFRDDRWQVWAGLSSSAYGRVRSEVERCRLIDAPPGVCHLDIGCENARIGNDPDGTIYLLDLEFAVAGPVPHYQLACVTRDCSRSAERFKAFAAGYGLTADDLAGMATDVDRLALLRQLRFARWAEERSPADVEQYFQAAKETASLLLGGA